MKKVKKHYKVKIEENDLQIEEEFKIPIQIVKFFSSSNAIKKQAASSKQDEEKKEKQVQQEYLLKMSALMGK